MHLNRINHHRGKKTSVYYREKQNTNYIRQTKAQKKLLISKPEERFTPQASGRAFSRLTASGKVTLILTVLAASSCLIKKADADTSVSPLHTPDTNSDQDNYSGLKNDTSSASQSIKHTQIPIGNLTTIKPLNSDDIPLYTPKLNKPKSNKPKSNKPKSKENKCSGGIDKEIDKLNKDINKHQIRNKKMKDSCLAMQKKLIFLFHDKKDMIKVAGESMHKLVDSFKQVQDEAIDRLNNITQQIIEVKEDVIDTTREVIDSAKNLTDNTKSVIEKAMNDSAEAFNNALDMGFNSSQAKYLETFGKHFDNYRNLSSEAVLEFSDSLNQIDLLVNNSVEKTTLFLQDYNNTLNNIHSEIQNNIADIMNPILNSTNQLYIYQDEFIKRIENSTSFLLDQLRTASNMLKDVTSIVSSADIANQILAVVALISNLATLLICLKIHILEKEDFKISQKTFEILALQEGKVLPVKTKKTRDSNATICVEKEIEEEGEKEITPMLHTL